MVPGEVLMAGSEPVLHRYRFSLEPSARVELANESSYCIDVAAGSSTVATGGAGGVTLLSLYGTRLGRMV
jgi:hypothetical protein